MTTTICIFNRIPCYLRRSTIPVLLRFLLAFYWNTTIKQANPIFIVYLALVHSTRLPSLYRKLRNNGVAKGNCIGTRFPNSFRPFFRPVASGGKSTYQEYFKVPTKVPILRVPFPYATYLQCSTTTNYEPKT